MTRPLTTAEQWLCDLVAYRTDGPRPDEYKLAMRLSDALQRAGAHAVEVFSAPRAAGEAPGWSVYARWGHPRLLLNAHLDTVPAAPDWPGDPWTAQVSDDRIVGLGTADTKGAVAAILAALETCAPHDLAILFSGDEERSGVCMEAFLASPRRHGLTHALVCEPTRLRAGTRHRGIVALRATADGPGGHSSMADQVASPLVGLLAAARELVDWGAAHRSAGSPGYEGYCLNVAQLHAGVAFNVIPAKASLEVSARPPPGEQVHPVIERLRSIVREHAPEARTEVLVSNPTFQTRDLDQFSCWIPDVVHRRTDLQFWTEAALLSEAGIDAVVLGPGSVEAAHAAGEWVDRNELAEAVQIFQHIIRSTRTRDSDAGQGDSGT